MYNISTLLKKHRLYDDFVKVKSKLVEWQFVCWIAGGAVRDFCLGREVHEFDLVTDATTENLKLLFPDAVLVGESFGVLKLPLSKGEFFDLTSFRQESDYFDGRRPSHLSTATPVKDSERRDFTINSLFWDDVRQVIIDYRGGQLDLVNRKLACVGIAETRFTEDYLRLLRLVRFAAQLNFEIAEESLMAARKHILKIRKVSGERIWAELKKMQDGSTWNVGLQQKLFRSMLEEVFETQQVSLDPVPESTESLLLNIFLLNPETDFSEVLKSRLRISNQELSIYKMIFFIMKNFTMLSEEQLALEVEKSSLCNEQFKLLVKAGLIPESVGQKLSAILNAHPIPLVTAREILDLIPSRCISDELKLIRLGQFNYVYRTKGEVVDYLKKKYAYKLENT